MHVVEVHDTATATAVPNRDGGRVCACGSVSHAGTLAERHEFFPRLVADAALKEAGARLGRFARVIRTAVGADGEYYPDPPAGSGRLDERIALRAMHKEMMDVFRSLSWSLKKNYAKLKRSISKLLTQEKNLHRMSHREFNWSWQEFHHNRIAIVNALISAFDIEKANYLEIGCATNDLFDSVMATRKTGVDPDRGGTHRMTSDAFFAQNTEKFDVIFIDGLHEYEQVRRDAINALNCLSETGYVAFHDLLPRNWKEQHIPPIDGDWTGDCWKAAVELSKSEGLDFKIVKVDHGVGVLRRSIRRFNGVVDLRNELRDRGFDYFADIVDQLPIIEWAVSRPGSKRRT